jgi:hypothetical protein
VVAYRSHTVLRALARGNEPAFRANKGAAVGLRTMRWVAFTVGGDYHGLALFCLELCRGYTLSPAKGYWPESKAGLDPSERVAPPVRHERDLKRVVGRGLSGFPGRRAYDVSARERPEERSASEAGLLWASRRTTALRWPTGLRWVRGVRRAARG